MMLSGPVGLFLIAHLLFPEPMLGANIREYYYGVMRPVWWLGMLTVVFSTVFRPLIFGHDLYTLDNASSLLFLVGFITLAISRRPTIHAVVVPIFLAVILLDILQWNPVIGSS